MTNDRQDFSFPVGKTVSGENGQNDGGLVRLQGHRKFCRSAGQRVNAVGKRFQLVVLPGLQGKGPCGKEAFLPT
jgi:hypothetical protein